jgi:hypothetical protein
VQISDNKIELRMPSYYSMDDYTFIGFGKSDRRGKMYIANIQNNKDNKIVKIHFGDSKYENFSDKTGLDAYPNLIHGDKKRKKRYIARHAGFIKEGNFSPGYFSMKYLWS